SSGGTRDALFCSRSHGQPSGPRSFATISQSFSNGENSAIADSSQPSALNSQLLSNAPERPMGAELGDFPGGFLAHVNRNPDHAGKGHDKNSRHQPRRNVTDAQRVIKRAPIRDRFGGVQENFRDPRHHDEDENEDVIAF